MPIQVVFDRDNDDADWSKDGVWDIDGVDSLRALQAWLHEAGMTPSQFKELPVYKTNVRRLVWLAGL